jgi:hypothetical protein
MTNVQLYFAIGVPTFTILCSIMIGVFQFNHVLTQISARFTTLENNMNSRFSLLEGDMKTLVRATNDLDVRLARLEERLTR